MEWVIIKLRDRNETPCGTEIIDGVEYYVDDMFDLEDGRIFFGFSTRKEAEKEAKEMRWIDKLTRLTGETKKYRYIVEREDRI